MNLTSISYKKSNARSPSRAIIVLSIFIWLSSGCAFAIERSASSFINTDDNWYYYFGTEDDDESITALVNSKGTSMVFKFDRNRCFYAFKKYEVDCQYIDMNDYSIPILLQTPYGCNNARINYEGGRGLVNLFGVIEITRENGHYVNSFSLFKKLRKPEIIKNVVHEMVSFDEVLIVKAISVNWVFVMSDCSIFLKFNDGLIKFDRDGNTNARLRSDLRLVPGARMKELEEEYYQVYLDRNAKKERTSYNDKIRFFYDKIFGD